MANLDLVAVRPAVSNLVPSRFDVAIVRGADTGFRQGGGSSWCRRGWDAGCAHLCNGELDVGNGFGECGIGGNQIFNGGVLLNGRVCQIVKGRCHLLCLFKFGGLICTKCCLAGSHALDSMHLSKGSCPVGLPVGPSVVEDGVTFLFLCQADVMFLHARAYLVPIVTMVLSEMGTPASAAKTLHFSCFLV